MIEQKVHKFSQDSYRKMWKLGSWKWDWYHQMERRQGSQAALYLLRKNVKCNLAENLYVNIFLNEW